MVCAGSRLFLQDLTSTAMAASKSVIVLLALAAVAAAVDNARVKKQVYLAGAYPYAAAPVAKAVLPPAKPLIDDGSWAPGKYDPVEVPVAAPLAAPIAPIAPVAPIAYPYAAAGYPYAAAAYPYAAAAYHYGDDGSYWPGKYGPENIQVL